MQKIKKILPAVLLFLLFIGLYFLPTILFPVNKEYYNSLKKPSYAPSAIVFGVVWGILYIIYALYLAIKLRNYTLARDQLFLFLMNFSISFFFNRVFFIDHKLFLSFAVTFLSFLTGLFIFIQTFTKNKKEGFLLFPYVIWTLYATILITHIYFLN